MPRIIPFLQGTGEGPLEPFVKDLGGKLGIRITVVSADGAVLADSEESPEKMESHQYRPEIFQALKGETTTAVRRSSTVKAEMLYMGFPLARGGRDPGVLRLSLRMQAIDRLVSSLQIESSGRPRRFWPSSCWSSLWVLHGPFPGP